MNHGWGGFLTTEYPDDTERLRGETYSAESFLVEDLHFITGPWRFAEEVEARLERRVIREAANPDAVCEFIPAVFLFELGEHLFEFDSVEGIV